MANNESGLLERTCSAIGKDLIDTLQKKKFCIVGCGGTGALFAEMLIRTGAKTLVLIDGDKVVESNLNRVIGFFKSDVGEEKVKVLESRFKKINDDIKIEAIASNFRQEFTEDQIGQKARDAVCNSDIIVITVDKNDIRIECENLAHEYRKEYIGIGVFVNENGNAGFECVWKPKTPIDKREAEGYGVGSYISIVVEATSVAFSMLLHHLRYPESEDFKRYYKTYDQFKP